MYTRCIQVLQIKLTIWKNLEKLEGKSGNLESLEIKLKNWTDATILKNWKIFENWKLIFQYLKVSHTQFMIINKKHGY